VHDKRSYKAGEPIFRRGEQGDELLLIRRGSVRVTLPLDEKQSHHLATFGRGDFIGEMSFLDKAPRRPTRTRSPIPICTRSRASASTPWPTATRKLAINLFDTAGAHVAIRLRYTTRELPAAAAS